MLKPVNHLTCLEFVEVPVPTRDIGVQGLHSQDVIAIRWDLQGHRTDRFGEAARAWGSSHSQQFPATVGIDDHAASIPHTLHGTGIGLPHGQTPDFHHPDRPFLGSPGTGSPV